MDLKYKSMGEKLELLSFGLAQFKLRSGKGNNWFWIYCHVIDADKYRVHLRDNMEQDYYPLKKDVRSFQKQELTQQIAE